ncbi:MAG: TIM barrel protein [Clostridiales bacterium]|nr:TIM barrel protein [Clostridiales bacterium]
MKNAPFFGPGGNSDSFNNLKKRTADAPAWVKEFGLDAYEYEAGRGVNGSPEMFAEIGKNAKEAGIKISIHAPYFISLSSLEEEKRLGSARYIIESAMALKLMDGETIVIHAGSCAKIDRITATEYAKRAMHHAISELDKLGLYGFRLGIETMGKVNQLGTLDEVLELCTVDETVVPVVDFGHMNAREQGGVFKSPDDYKRVFDEISKKKGAKYAENLHCHFSKIEYTTGGEKRHLTFEDTVFGPDFEPLMKAVSDMGITPTFICESDGTQAEDALTMKKYYLSLK